MFFSHLWGNVGFGQMGQLNNLRLANISGDPAECLYFGENVGFAGA